MWRLFLAAIAAPCRAAEMPVDKPASAGRATHSSGMRVQRAARYGALCSSWAADLEVRTVLAAARDDRLEHAWHLALSGLRRGEVCGLRWTDVDLRVRTLTIVENPVTVDGAALTSEPKTEAGKRTLPLTEPLVKVLRRAKRRQAAEQLKAGSLHVDTGYLVVDEIGRRLHPDTVSDRWNQLVAAADVRRISLHDARHTCGTLMHVEGVPTAVIARLAWPRFAGLHHADLHPLPARRSGHAADVLGAATRA
jgi:integrase